jgi:hypothetical protein
MRNAMPLHCTGLPENLKIVMSIGNVLQFCIALKKGVKGLK